MSTDYSLACTHCHEVILKSMGDAVKVRSKVLLIKNNCTFAVCKGCNSEIPLPLRLDESLTKALRRGEPYLYLRK